MVVTHLSGSHAVDSERRATRLWTQRDVIRNTLLHAEKLFTPLCVVALIVSLLSASFGLSALVIAIIVAIFPGLISVYMQKRTFQSLRYLYILRFI